MDRIAWDAPPGYQWKAEVFSVGLCFSPKNQSLMVATDILSGRFPPQMNNPLYKVIYQDEPIISHFGC